MKLRDHYDWMVLGNHPGALLSAGLAARLGLSVLVLPIFPGMGLVTSRSGDVVDPESNYLIGLGRGFHISGLLAECLGRLGVLPAELEQIQGSCPLPQVLTPDVRLNLSTNDRMNRISWERELGSSRAAALGLIAALSASESEVLSYWLQLPERLTLVPGDKRTLSSKLRLGEIRRKVVRESKSAPMLAGRSTSGRSPNSSSPFAAAEAELIGTLLSGLWQGLSGTVSERPSPERLLQLSVLGRTGASFSGGMTAYREFLSRLAARLGAHFPPKMECKRIFIENGRFAGVQLASRGSMISGGGAIVGCALDQVKELVTEGGRGWFKKLKKSPRPAGWVFTLAFTVRSEAIPPGVSPRMVWKESDAPALEIEIANPTEYGQRGSGTMLILARSIMPFESESLSEEYQRKIGGRIFRLLFEIFPFIDQHVLSIYPEIRSGSSEEKTKELQEIYGFSSLDQIPENLRRMSLDGEGGVGSRSGIEGLFVSSGESFPDLGSFGGTVAALESVSWLAHRSGLAGPFV